MPKETITPTHNTREDRTGNWVPYPAVEVSWMRDLGHVGIGVTTPAEQDGQYHLIDVLYGDPDSREKIGRAVWSALRRRLADVGILAHDGDISELASAETLDPDTAAAVGREVLDAVTGSSMGYQGYFTSLTERRDLNHLIRQLKRARDGAFGRDE